MKELEVTKGTAVQEASQIPKNLHLETARTTKPGIKRLTLTFTVLFSFILGFPFLWKSVEIYRSPLPFSEIDSLHHDSLQFPCHFQAILLASDPIDSSLFHSSILSQISNSNPGNPLCGSCLSNISVSVIVDSPRNCQRTGPKTSYVCGSIQPEDLNSIDDDNIDEALKTLLGGRVYSVVVSAMNDDVAPRGVVGKHRHAWVVTKMSSQVKTIVSEVIVKLFNYGGSEEGPIKPEFMPVGADGRIILSFNLLNSDPRDWIFDWDFDKIDETLLAPVVEALAPIADVTVESQVLFYTPKASFSSWNEKMRSHVFYTRDLPFFVNSNEWHLDTSTAAGGRSKILQFVVYVSSANECPLKLVLPNGLVSSTNGFISPMWGGVMIWNPIACLKQPSSRQNLSLEDMHNIVEVFLGQLRQLLGLKSDVSFFGSSIKFKLLPSEKGFSEWELDFLSRQHTCFNLHSTVTTLTSLSRLVKSLPRMIIINEIGRQVKVSLEAAKLAIQKASFGYFDEAAVSSRRGRSLAEDAFYHPSITSVSYFSFEHCFAVYSPFFLPVLMHVVLAAVKEWKRYKRETAKYLASKRDN